jgi:hypothetical protein
MEWTAPVWGLSWLLALSILLKLITRVFDAKLCYGDAVIEGEASFSLWLWNVAFLFVLREWYKLGNKCWNTD